MTLKISLFVCLAYLAFAQNYATQEILSQLPDSKIFWKEDKDLYKKIQEDEHIVVLAKIKDFEKQKQEWKHLNLQSAGHIKAPLDYTYKRILSFEEYPKMSMAFDRVNFDSAKSLLKIRVGALNYYASLSIRMRFEDKDKIRLIHWLCIDGPFAGMKGSIVLESVKKRVTEISMHSNYEAIELPLPKILIGFGMEVAGRQIAASMRNFVENEYKKQ